MKRQPVFSMFKVILSERKRFIAEYGRPPDRLHLGHNVYTRLRAELLVTGKIAPHENIVRITDMEVCILDQAKADPNAVSLELS